MKKEYEDFLLSEYKNSNFEPFKISLGKYDFFVPVAYATGNYDYSAFEQALFSQYLKNQATEIAKYSKDGVRKIPTLRFKDMIIVKPYSLRNLQDDEAKLKVVENIYARYKKAVRLTMLLNNANPDNSLKIRVDTDNMKRLNKAYNQYLAQKFKDKALVSAAKMSDFTKQGGTILYNTFKVLTAPVFKNMSDKYLKRLEHIKKIFEKNHKRIGAVLGAATLCAFLSLSVYKCANPKKERKSDIIEAGIAPDKTLKNISDAVIHYKHAAKKDNTSKAKQNTATKTIGFETLDENVQEALTAQGLGKDQLNDVQKHNLAAFINTQQDFRTFVAFAENFHSTTYDDNKGFLTIGYGCTNYLDEKGNPLEKCGIRGKMSAFVQKGQYITQRQAMQQVDRASYFYLLPKILKNVKVKLNNTKMFVTKNFAFVANNEFGDSEFVKALNENKPNNHLSRCLALWKVDAGISKRFFVLHMILNNYITADEIKTFKPAGCYNLQIDQCLVCHKNPDGSTKMKKTPVVTTEIKNGKKKKIRRFKNRPVYKIQNGMPQFYCKQQAIDEAVALMKAEPDEKCVAQIVPLEKKQTKYLSENTPKVNLVKVKQNKNARS